MEKGKDFLEDEELEELFDEEEEVEEDPVGDEGDPAEDGEEPEDASALAVTMQREALEREALKTLDAEEASKKLKPLQALEFVKKEEDIDAILKSPESFNSFMNFVVGKTLEYAFQSIPSVTSNLVQNQVEQQVVVEKFYDKNEDLLQFRNVVKNNYVKLAKTNPDWGLKKLLDEAGKESRAQLKLKAKIEADAKRKQADLKKPSPVALPHMQRRAASKGVLTGQRKLIADIL